MSRNPREVSASGSVIALLVVLTADILEKALIIDNKWYWYLVITIPLIIFIALFVQSKRITIK